MACLFWLTYQQSRELGGYVKKGEHGSPVVYASTFKKKGTNDQGQESEQEIPFLKEYTVFNASQCEGLPPHYYQLAEPPKEKIERIETALSRFFANTKADIRYGRKPSLLYARRRLRADAPVRDVSRCRELAAAIASP